MYVFDILIFLFKYNLINISTIMLYYNFFSYSYSTVKWSFKISRYIYKKVKKNPQQENTVSKTDFENIAFSDSSNSSSEEDWITVEKMQ